MITRDVLGVRYFHDAYSWSRYGFLGRASVGRCQHLALLRFLGLFLGVSANHVKSEFLAMFEWRRRRFERGSRLRQAHLSGEASWDRNASEYHGCWPFSAKNVIPMRWINDGRCSCGGAALQVLVGFVAPL